MNFILYVHDTGQDPVWDATDPTVLKRVEREINELVSDYTMGRVTVDAVPDAITEDFGGHTFQVMCARCLQEPFDIGDTECEEDDDDAER